MKKIVLLVIFMFIALDCFAGNYLLNGGQESEIKYEMVQVVTPKSATKKLVLSWVEPESFSSSTYNQKITSLDFNFSPSPNSREEIIDDRGNKVIVVKWQAPGLPVKTTVKLTAENKTKLVEIKTTAPFPLGPVPESVRVYLSGTDQVDIDNEKIRAMALKLTKNASTQFDAVQKILIWLVDHMHYVLTPKSYDAVYSMKTGKGNCQNYSHLSAALMRCVGLPVRIINGVTSKEPYDIDMGNGMLTMKMAQGRHSWIEVWFPDLGWMPFDPQNSQMFVSNRFIRVEAGLDNNETSQDGLIRWTYSKGQDGTPEFKENIAVSFVRDKIRLAAKKTNYGPNALMVGPPVKAVFTKIVAPKKPPAPKPVTIKDLKHLDYSMPYIFGNLDFPENLDFAFVAAPVEKGADGVMQIRKNFLVETAEYVTTKGRQYAQTFEPDKPMRLTQIGLALHKFGGYGQLWVELYADDSGVPGKYLATSDFLLVDKMKFSPGYNWVDFDFNKNNVILSPGRYWIALSFTGGPIVNWFFTYGKPVGPEDGTRYKKMFDTTWSRCLSYEFNYRIMGLTPTP